MPCLVIKSWTLTCRWFSAGTAGWFHHVAATENYAINLANNGRAVLRVPCVQDAATPCSRCCTYLSPTLKFGIFSYKNIPLLRADSEEQTA